jgi:hypothetical protein
MLDGVTVQAVACTIRERCQCSDPETAVFILSGTGISPVTETLAAIAINTNTASIG